MTQRPVIFLDKRRFMSSHANVRSTIQRQAWMQKLVFRTSTCAGFPTRMP